MENSKEFNLKVWVLEVAEGIPFTDNVELYLNSALESFPPKYTSEAIQLLTEQLYTTKARYKEDVLLARKILSKDPNIMPNSLAAFIRTPGSDHTWKLARIKVARRLLKNYSISTQVRKTEESNVVDNALLETIGVHEEGEKRPVPESQLSTLNDTRLKYNCSPDKAKDYFMQLAKFYEEEHVLNFIHASFEGFPTSGKPVKFKDLQEVKAGWVRKMFYDFWYYCALDKKQDAYVQAVLDNFETFSCEHETLRKSFKRVTPKDYPFSCKILR
ncbi:hypothetical protein MKJ04_11435 [Pontibacter sp. E15-1]|uniref:hypothetical protein n=1 Tax=Pontibacter sp. E15-1 TaxID=2919918 RepID=UPI001F4F1124|nr:hypothetical protein [Pontibacter sp. E15-1]MCJ8165456.1 hypothetical protein [Pontibacter sp. E15-1]